ncbi:MAG: DUF4190 domain-containing protein [Chthoniobacterales bacterium]|nr:DUF4190 domain-containing protein [Chthoniobacterales bacterium]
MKIFVHKDGQQHGPFTLEELRTSVSSGAFSASDLCWHTGLEEWQPASALLDPKPPPLAGSAATHGTKTDPLSIWSLVLGILSFLCFSLLAGIPAIICGHVSLGRLKKSALLRGKGMAITGLVLGYMSLVFVLALALLALPFTNGTICPGGRFTTMRSEAQQIRNGLRMAAMERNSKELRTIGFPADVGLHTAAEVRTMLVSGGYLSEDIDFEAFIIGNVSVNDHADTILIKSKPTTSDERVFILQMDGDSFYQTGEQSIGRDPPRSPAYLE